MNEPDLAVSLGATPERVQTEADPTATINCPACKIGFRPDGLESRCPNCTWRGKVLVFSPPPLQVDAGATALPDDATCAHHPSKRAESLCAGTGDYICALCTIEFDGETYSAEYFNRAGVTTADQAFAPHLRRPDSTVVLFMALLFLPYVNVIWLVAWPVWVVRGWWLLSKASRQRQEDPLFARVVGDGRIGLIGVLLFLVTIGLTIGTLAILFS